MLPLSTININSIIGRRVDFLVKKGETWQHKLTIVDLVGAAVPVPATLTMTCRKVGSDDFVLTETDGLTLGTSDITINKLENMDTGFWAYWIPVQVPSGPKYYLYGQIEVI
jgi:hypothetical protein